MPHYNAKAVEHVQSFAGECLSELMRNYMAKCFPKEALSLAQKFASGKLETPGLLSSTLEYECKLLHMLDALVHDKTTWNDMERTKQVWFEMISKEITKEE